MALIAVDAPLRARLPDLDRPRWTYLFDLLTNEAFFDEREVLDANIYDEMIVCGVRNMPNFAPPSDARVYAWIPVDNEDHWVGFWRCIVCGVLLHHNNLDHIFSRNHRSNVHRIMRNTVLNMRSELDTRRRILCSHASRIAWGEFMIANHVAPVLSGRDFLALGR